MKSKARKVVSVLVSDFQQGKIDSMIYHDLIKGAMSFYSLSLEEIAKMIDEAKDNA